jgi:hypothetical protein
MRQLYKIVDSLNQHGHYLYADGYWLSENNITFYIEPTTSEKHKTIVQIFSLYNILYVSPQEGLEYRITRDTGEELWEKKKNELWIRENSFKSSYKTP